MVQRTTELIESGDIFFFYRPRLGVEEVRGREDVQRLFMALAPEKPRKLYRLFVIGRKKLPEATSGAKRGERRNWALNVLTSRKAEELRRELLGKEYETETRGERHVGAAKPIGEGKYQLLRHGNHTELAYALSLPGETGPAQEEFEIAEEASYVVAVKNPELSIPGFPAPKQPPAYRAALKAKFGDRRWIDADDPALLDQERTQLLLVAAHAGDLHEELGVEIDVEDERHAMAAVCGELKLHCAREAVKPLLAGEFPSTEQAAEGEEVERLSPERSPSKGGKIGGKVAAARGASAAAITKLLGGVDFPRSRKELVDYAEEHKDRLVDSEEAIATLRRLPVRRYRTMAEVAVGLGEIR